MKLLTILLIVIMAACQTQSPDVSTENQSGEHKIIVEEVIQTTNYTYLHVTENNSKLWMAVTKMEVEKGESFYYKEGAPMENFKSKELDRTFETILFVEALSTTPFSSESVESHASPLGTQQSMQSGKPTIGKLELSIEPVEGGITIAELFANKKTYNGKIVKIKGQVAKINVAIMERNWIHLQDGTEHAGDFDLTITSDAEVKAGDVIIVEGKITLDKDFGYGYFYKILMEEGKVVE